MDALIVTSLLLIATLLLVSEKLRADVVAMTVLAALIVLRQIAPEEALSGFSNPATVTVACMFLLSAGLQGSGVVRFLGDRLLVHGPFPQWVLLVLMTVTIAPLSAFINNTAVVAIFLPIILRAAHFHGLSPSGLMLPLSYLAMLGGTCTLLGTSTNILVSSLAYEQGLPEFRMFEFAWLGLILLVAGTLYLLLFGHRLIPERIPAAEDGGDIYDVSRYLSELVVVADSPLIGKSLVEAQLGEKHDFEVLGHSRDGVLRVPGGYGSMREGDLLLVEAPVKSLVALGPATGLELKPGRHPDVASLKSADAALVEAVITPNSDLQGRTLKGINFRSRYGGTALAIRRHGESIREKIGRLPLRLGDELLILAPRVNLPRMRQQSSFIVLQELDVPVFRPLQALAACMIVTGVVVAATLGLLKIANAAIVGAVLMVLTGCLQARRVYQSVDWQVIFLLAGLIPLGTALETSGAAHAGVEALLGMASGSPILVLSLFFLIASLLTGFMSNTATAALLAPLAIEISRALEVSERPFLVALTFAASAAFYTPIGYQTNLLVYGPGGYRFADFLRVGGPLTLIYWVLATILIPRLFPF